MSVRLTLEVRFWGHVNRDGPIRQGMDTPCWEWMAARNNHGYGVINLGPKLGYAHRVAWELTHGSIPDGLCVLHRCDNPACVRHLFLGTMRDNTKDMMQKGRHSHGDRHGKLVSAGRKRAQE